MSCNVPHPHYNQDNARILKLTLERSTEIMSETETIRAGEGMNYEGILTMITDAHKALNGAADVVGLLCARPFLLEHRATRKEAAVTAAKANTTAREVARAMATARANMDTDARQRRDAETSQEACTCGESRKAGVRTARMARRQRHSRLCC